MKSKQQVIIFRKYADIKYIQQHSHQNPITTISNPSTIFHISQRLKIPIDFFILNNKYNKIQSYTSATMTDRRFMQHQQLNSKGARMAVQCRFCRHKQQYNKFEYVAPCGCIGPTRYVHRRCIQTWFTVKFEHVYNQPYEGDPLQFNVFCEICQQRMEIEFSLAKKCSKYDEFIQKLETDKLWFALIIIVAIVAICLLVFICILSSISQNTNSNLIAIIISLSCLILVTDIAVFFWKFAIIKSIEIDHVANNKDPPKLMAFAEKDINEMGQYEYDSDPHFGQPKGEPNPADKSLMLQSRRGSDSENKPSSVASKTFTDIVMRQMYKHDLPSERDKTSNYTENRPLSQRGKNTIVEDKSSRNTKLQRKQSQQRQVQIESVREKKDQGIQMTVFEEKKAEVGVQRSVREQEQPVQKTDKSIQMSFNDKEPSFSNRRSRSRKIFHHDEPMQKISEEQGSRAHQRLIEEHKQEGGNMFTPKQSEERIDSDRYNIKPQAEDEVESKHFNIIKVNTVQVKTPTVQAVKQKSQKMISTRESKLKLKNIKDPIKIKIRF